MVYREHFYSKMSVVDTSVDIDENNFRLQNRRFMLTYRTHLNKAEFVSWFATSFGTVPFIRLAHELGDSTHDYEHTHVVIDFGKVFQSRNCRIFDYTEIHPHIKKILSAKHFLNSKEYLAKEDPENHDLKAKPSVFTQVSACSNLSEVMNLAQRPSDAPGLLTLYNISKRTIVPDTTDLARIERWQRQLYEMVKITPTKYHNDPINEFQGTSADLETCMREWTSSVPVRRNGPDRTIIVIYDPLGSAGKTWCSKAFWSADPSKYVMFQGVAKYRDVATQIDNAIEGGWDGHCILINITRECADHKIYNSLECIRDGVVTTEKFSGRPIKFDIHHMVLLVNVMPDLRGVTTNRWEIYGLNEYLLLDRINTHDAIRIFDSESMDRKENRSFINITAESRAQFRALELNVVNSNSISPLPSWSGIK